MLTVARLGWLVAALAVTILAVTLVVRRPEPRPTPAARFDSSQVDTIPLDSIRSYVKSLNFDTVLGAADQQLVDFEKGLIGRGDTARIEPEEGSYRITRSDLARGRIIARIRSKVVYDSLGFGPWWTYWWVDGKRGWRSVFIADTSARTSRPQGRMNPRNHYKHHWRQAIAHFTTGSGIKPWGTCDDWCCQ